MQIDLAQVRVVMPVVAISGCSERRNLIMPETPHSQWLCGVFSEEVMDCDPLEQNPKKDHYSELQVTKRLRVSFSGTQPKNHM